VGWVETWKGQQPAKPRVSTWIESVSVEQMAKIVWRTPTGPDIALRLLGIRGCGLSRRANGPSIEPERKQNHEHEHFGCLDRPRCSSLWRWRWLLLEESALARS